MPDQTASAEKLLGEWLKRFCQGTPDDWARGKLSFFKEPKKCNL